MDDKKDMINSELKIYFDGRFDNVEKDIRSIKEDLKKIEGEIHTLGNGKPGIVYRVDRLEKAQEGAKESKKDWIGWIIVLIAALLGSFLGPLFVSLLDK